MVFFGRDILTQGALIFDGPKGEANLTLALMRYRCSGRKHRRFETLLEKNCVG